MADYNVLFATDNHYCYYMFVVCQSILDSLNETPSNAQDCIVFHVLLDQTADRQRTENFVWLFSRINDAAKVKFNFNFYQVDDSLLANCKHIERCGVLSLSTYYRLLFDHVLPSEIERILYLDIDLFVCVDIREIFQQHPMQDEVMYVASEFYYLRFSNNPCDKEPVIELSSKSSEEKPLYFKVRQGIQAGVMLINIEQWRSLEIEQKCLEIANKWELIAHDQDLLSIVCAGRVSYLSWEWNCSMSRFGLNNDGFFRLRDGKTIDFDKLPINGCPSREQLRELCAHPKIVHFTGALKPWNMGKNANIDQIFSYRFQMQYINRWMRTFKRMQALMKALLSNR